MLLAPEQIFLIARGLPPIPANDLGGGGGSSSSSASTTTTVDKRLALQSGVGISSDSSSVTVNALDGGAIAAAAGAINSAIDLAKSGDSTSGKNYTDLLGLTGNVIDKLLGSLGEDRKLVDKSIQSYTPTTSGGTEAAQQKALLIGAGILVAGFVAIKVIK